MLLIIILSTISKKSLLFMTLACLKKFEMIVIIALFQALLNNFLDWLKKAEIDCLKWNTGEINLIAMILVSVERAIRWEFMTYTSQIHQQELLWQIMMNKCHLTFTASDYWSKLWNLRHLQVLQCQMMLLTAILSLTLENELSESMLMWCAWYVRASIVRHNIQYLMQ